MTTPIVMSYASGAMDTLDDFLKQRGTQRPRTYSKTEESAWQKTHSKATMGQEAPLVFRDLSTKERAARIQELIQTGLGDGSIAVRLNRQGFACKRADVHWVRTGREAPNGQGTFEETSFVGVS